MKSKPGKKPSLDAEVKDVITTLKSLASKKWRDGMARYAIPSENALGMSVSTIQKVAKEIGKDHELALALWKTNIYEARMLCAFIDEVDKVTAAQMDEWCNDFDSWAIVDTVCFKLFDRSPLAWRKINQWAKKRGEFQKRAAFALLASVAAHDKEAPTENFLKCLPLIEQAADDNRNFVKKGVSWALRAIGHRNSELHDAAVKLSQQLAESTNATTRWIGKDALRDITRPTVKKKVNRRDAERV
jgi:3-methyladenine DNA glycosylase AlkD